MYMREASVGMVLTADSAEMVGDMRKMRVGAFTLIKKFPFQLRHPTPSLHLQGTESTSQYTMQHADEADLPALKATHHLQFIRQVLLRLMKLTLLSEAHGAVQCELVSLD